MDSPSARLLTDLRPSAERGRYRDQHKASQNRARVFPMNGYADALRDPKCLTGRVGVVGCCRGPREPVHEPPN
eukprot:4463996-Heterocapsa_arctica.AAC.1